MAILTDLELAELRREVAKEVGTVTWDKATINAALQAIEDWYEGQRATVAGDINAATTPFVFTGLQKKKMAKHFIRQKFEKGG